MTFTIIYTERITEICFEGVFMIVKHIPFRFRWWQCTRVSDMLRGDYRCMKNGRIIYASYSNLLIVSSMNII